MTTDVFSHPWLSGLFGDDELADILGPDATLRHMITVEAAHARALGEVGIVSSEVATRAADAIVQIKLDMVDLKNGTARDGLAVPSLARALKLGVEEDLLPAVHKGLTSQDVIDTSLILSLKAAIDIFQGRIECLSAELEKLIAKYGKAALMGRTRMQAAYEITVADRLGSWQRPLQTHQARLNEITPRLLRLQLGGAVGNRAAWGEKADIVAAAMARDLGLAAPQAQWHSERDTIVEFANWLSLVTGTLGKIGQDIALMAQQGIDEIRISGAGGSSAMPHKQNPIKAELLVTLASYNATQLAGMHQALVHEQERSGMAWALEWMILPQMVLSTGCSLKQSALLFQSITSLGRGSSQAP